MLTKPYIRSLKLTFPRLITRSCHPVTRTAVVTITITITVLTTQSLNMSSRGESLLSQAEKKASSSTGWFSSSSSKWEDAADLFQQVRTHWE